MAVHAQYGFPHDPRAITRPAALDSAMMSASAMFHGEPVNGGHPLLFPAAVGGGNAAFSDLTCINTTDDDTARLAPRKRARVGGDVIADLQGQRAALLPPVVVPMPQAFAAAGDVQGSRMRCSGAAASTSGRLAPAPSQGVLLSHLYRHGVETDALIRIENERLRAGLQEARRRHVRAVVSAVERAAARRLRAAEAEVELAMARNAELDERLRQTVAEGHAWRDVARSHEAAAAGLRATLDSLVLVRSSPPATTTATTGGEGDAAAEDAESCCFEEQQEEEEDAGGSRTRAACKVCGEADACVLLLPCRHLCLCGGCEAAVEACPVCANAKNASLHVLLP